MTTREKIIAAAKYTLPEWGCNGSFVNTDGKWNSCRTPREFKNFLEKEFGFTVVKCYSTEYSTAIAETSDGYEISYNGHCKKIDAE